MQDYRDFAAKNGVELLEKGPCQFCGANLSEGIAACVEAFNTGLDAKIDFYNPANLIYKIMSVDAHTLQHPEIHGRWNNHLHLTRLHLVFKHEVIWTHNSTVKLSRQLNKHKQYNRDEYLHPPKKLERGEITIDQLVQKTLNEESCKIMIEKWAKSVYDSWKVHHTTVEIVAKMFISE